MATCLRKTELYPSLSVLSSCFRSELLFVLKESYSTRRTNCSYDSLLVCFSIYLHFLAKFQTIWIVFVTMICKGVSLY